MVFSVNHPIGVLTALLLSSLCWQANALYSAKSPVKVLDAPQLTQLKKSGDPFVVEFYSSGCVHCRNFASEYEKAAEALKGIVKVVGVEDQQAMAEENIRGFPAVKFYHGTEATDFAGSRTASAVVDFAIKQVTSVAKKRLGGSASSSSSSKKPENADSHSSKAVVTLTDKNFETKLSKDNPTDVWFVVFYAPWCGHCKAMMPAWEKAAAEMKGNIIMAQVDGTENTMLAQHFGIKGFPTIKLFPVGGDRKWHSFPKLAVDYDGGRDQNSFVDFAMQYAGQGPSEPVQLLSQPQLEEECMKGVCLVAFLPHILDSKAAGREAFIATYSAVMRAAYSMPIKFFWSEGGEQFEFEEKLHLQFGFPAVVALNLEKSKFAVHKGTFAEDSLRQFITSLMAGRQAVDPLPSSLPMIKKIQAWDGKDAAPESDDDANDEL